MKKVLIEDMLKTPGGECSQGPDQAPYAIVDGNLITGQNPASPEPAARKRRQALN